VDTAEREIGRLLADFYRISHPDLWKSRQADIDHAIDSVREIYRNNFFPSMNFDWRTYPDNIGHRISPGCFRCHEGRHVNQYGERISHDCSVCHTFLNRREGDGETAIIEKGEFIHPTPLEGQHETLRCSQCHDGGPASPQSCTGCHDETTALRSGESDVLARFEVSASPMADLECESCHDLSEPRSLAAIDAMCTDCHDPDEDERFDGMLARWDESIRSAAQAAAAAVAELERVVERAPRGTDQSRRKAWLEQTVPALDFLGRAVPLHNYQESLEVYERITRQAQQLLEAGRLAAAEQ
ncbi:MAG: cytochrome c3 family protein, partial [Planctomycetota bacterium]|jgi:hypothetical protein